MADSGRKLLKVKEKRECTGGGYGRHNQDGNDINRGQ